MIFFASLIFLTNLSTWSRTDLVFLGVLLKSYACCLALTNFLPVVRPAPRLYWQWMFARRCCPRRACYTLRKSRRFITWQIYCLPCLSLPSRNLSEWGNSTSSGSRPLFFLKMKKKGGNIWYFWWHCWCLLPTKYRCKHFVQPNLFFGSYTSAATKPL